MTFFAFNATWAGKKRKRPLCLPFPYFSEGKLVSMITVVPFFEQQKWELVFKHKKPVCEASTGSQAQKSVRFADLLERRREKTTQLRSSSPRDKSMIQHQSRAPTLLPTHRKQNAPFRGRPHTHTHTHTHTHRHTHRGVESVLANVMEYRYVIAKGISFSFWKISCLHLLCARAHTHTQIKTEILNSGLGKKASLCSR